MTAAFPLRVTDDGGVLHAWHWITQLSGQEVCMTLCGQLCGDWALQLGGTPDCSTCAEAVRAG